MSVAIFRGSISKADLSRLDGQEQKLLVIAGHISNELATLQKLLVGCMNVRPASTAAKSAFTVQNWVAAKLLIGKLHEGSKAIRRYYHSGVSRTYHPLLPPEAREAEEYVSDYFRNRENPIRTIRNSAAFHYSCEGVPALIASLPDDKSLAMYFGEHDGNSLHFFAEELLFAEQFPQGTSEEVHAAFDTLIKDVTALARKMVEFFQGCMLIALTRAIPGRKLIREVVPAVDTQHIDFHVIPFFLDGHPNGSVRRAAWRLRNCIGNWRIGGPKGRTAT